MTTRVKVNFKPINLKENIKIVCFLNHVKVNMKDVSPQTQLNSLHKRIY